LRSRFPRLQALAEALPWRAALPILLSVGLGACVSSVVVQEGGLENPPISEKGVVVLFAGLTPAGDSMANSGMYTLTQDIRTAGIRADVYNPSHWQKAADMILAQPDVAKVPVAVGGYSMGGGAATRFAERLRGAGIVVQTLLVFEPYYPAPVACNVRQAIDMYGGAGSMNFSKRLQPSRTFRGDLTQVNWTKWNPKDGRHDHWGVSKEPEALRFVKEELIDGGTVRIRPASPGEEQCLANR
jgi:pimeloyl-ACP methyl ester carboxylesterase